MKHEILTGHATLQLPQSGAVFLPFRGSGFYNSYYQEGAFCYDLHQYHGGTSGPDGVCSWDHIALFLTDRGGKISSDGHTVTIEIPAGQSLLYMNDATDEAEKWSLYKQLVQLPELPTVPRQDFWFLPEYVTWVEQGRVAKPKGLHPRVALDEQFVLDYMDRIEALGLPKGKLTLDDGWQELCDGDMNTWTDGYWQPDSKKFPDFAGLIATIKARGFVPSLWLGIPSVPHQARLVTDNPALFDGVDQDENEQMGDRYYYVADEALYQHFTNVLTPLAEMGIRKFKFDFFYGPRKRMREIMAVLHQVVRDIDPTIEIESHHPDPFFSCYCDTFRLNDVHCVPGFDWRGLTLAHIYLANHLATDCILNLDHLGGNTATVCEDMFLQHLQLFDAVQPKPQYPVISILPDQFSADGLQAVKTYIEQHSIQQ